MSQVYNWDTPPVKAATWQFDISLVSVAAPTTFKTTVTLAAGDIQVSKDGGQYANLATFPPAERDYASGADSGTLLVLLTALEMTASKVTVRFHDVAGAEWADVEVAIWPKVAVTPDVNVATQANIDFGALQKASLNAATPASVVGSVGSVANIPPTGTGLTAIPWNAAWDAEAQSEAQDAITASALATAAALATVDTVVDAIKAKTDLLDTNAITVVSAVDGDAVTVYTYSRWNFSLTLGVSLADRVAGGLYFTVKRDPRGEADSLSMLQVKETTGALYLNRSPALAAYATLVVTTEATGVIAVNVTVAGVAAHAQIADPTVTIAAVAPERGLIWEVKKVTTAGPAVVARGPFHIDAAVARATT